MKSDKKWFVSALFLAALVMMMVLPGCTIAFSCFPSGSSGLNISMVSNSLPDSSTIVVPDDYPSISAAIGNASTGDTIVVRSGTYLENPTIDKPLTLQGENSADTKVIGTGGHLGASVFTIGADNVKVSGFTIRSLNYSTSANYAYGIMIKGDKCMITGNNIVNTLSGIFCSVQSSILIAQNNITGNQKDGIRCYGGFNNTFSGNKITNNKGSAIAIEGYSDNIIGNNLSQNTMGIGLGVTYSVVFKNNMTQNSNSGIYFTGSNNIVSANYVADNKYGIYLVSSFGLSSNNTIIHNNFIRNHQNADSTSIYFTQIWDEGYPLGGNYWSDYSIVCPNATEIANSGIMNLPYSICANNTDKNPLMTLFDTSSTVASPSVKNPPTAGSNHVAAFWSFDSIRPTNVTIDSTGNNPAILGIETPVYSYMPQLVDGEIGNALNFN
jgi:parallel beta-helix repeat protein